MNSLMKYLHFLRPSVQRDLVALVHGCHDHPANRAIRHAPMRFDRMSTLPQKLIVPACPICADLYAAKRRVKRLLG